MSSLWVHTCSQPKFSARLSRTLCHLSSCLFGVVVYRYSPTFTRCINCWLQTTMSHGTAVPLQYVHSQVDGSVSVSTQTPTVLIDGVFAGPQCPSQLRPSKQIPLELRFDHQSQRLAICPPISSRRYHHFPPLLLSSYPFDTVQLPFVRFVLHILSATITFSYFTKVMRIISTRSTHIVRVVGVGCMVRV